MIRRESIYVNGIVQGVGFRPFIYRLAHNLKLAGFVKNSSHGVLIEVEGYQEALNLFIQKIENKAPPLARISELTRKEIPVKNEIFFQIVSTSGKEKATTQIAPDVSICDDCLAEMIDPHNRRFRYPFINCTNCGPRYTIVQRIPYDRPFTSMSVFPMCPACQQEYDDPLDRRFHAQPNACPVCGPQLSLLDKSGKHIKCKDTIEQSVQFLREGKIVAIRGLGGFHLAVDAFNEKALQKLRERKGRQEKPFALMARDRGIVSQYCLVSDLEENQLSHFTRPIVLLRKKENIQIPELVAPDNKYLGFMLPYTPLHHLLLNDNFDLLIMTSANFTDEPIAMANQESLDRLGNIADYFLVHNREIEQRCDDSILRVTNGNPFLIRRSRGFVPAPISIKPVTQKAILAVGGELKNTIAIGRNNHVFFSQHIGDLDNPAAYQFFENSINHLQQILQIQPDVIVCDKHPEYLSTKWALKQKLPVVKVQHHHAHLASVMADNGVESTTIGLILDGTGFGDDGTIWGGEVLVGTLKEFERFAWLQPTAMPGGAKAIKQPWRMAFSYLYNIYHNEIDRLDLPVIRNLKQNDLILLKQILDQGINAPLTSSCGRLFDAVSAILGICNEITFEAQAAIKLEMTVEENVDDYYNDVIDKNRKWNGSISLNHLIRRLVEDYQNRIEISTIAAKFHNTLVEIFVNVVKQAVEQFSTNQVGLSGGAYQNDYLNRHLQKRLIAEGLKVLTHKNVPANDGGLALGQIAVANNKL